MTDREMLLPCAYSDPTQHDDGPSAAEAAVEANSSVFYIIPDHLELDELDAMLFDEDQFDEKDFNNEFSTNGLEIEDDFLENEVNIDSDDVAQINTEDNVVETDNGYEEEGECGSEK